MPETSFSDDLKHMVRHTADRARERLASVQNGLPALGNIRAWPRATKIKVGASVAAIALFLSTITDSALGSALGALAALVASEVLVTLNAATVVQPYLPTRYWLAWIDFFRQPVFWRDIQRGFGIQAVYVVVFLAAAWANFSTKDITA